MAPYADIIWAVMPHMSYDPNHTLHTQALRNCNSTFFNDFCYCLPGIWKRNCRWISRFRLNRLSKWCLNWEKRFCSLPSCQPLNTGHAFWGGWIDKNPLVLQVLLLVKGKVRPEMFSLPIGQFNANARLCHLDIGVNSETGRSQTYLEVVWIRSFWFILSTSFTDVLLNEWE